jgi:aryl-alcohol dehydrogenase-like predicted oxidoreductase
MSMFDTAPAYGDGASESNLGRALARCHGEFPAEPLITTKVLVGPSELGDIRGALLRSLEGSLSRLGRDRIDVLMLHNRVAWARGTASAGGIGPLLTVDEVLEERGVAGAVRELMEAGQLRAVGFTAWGGEPSAIDELLESGLFSAVNAEYNALNPSAGASIRFQGEGDHRAVIDRARSAGVGTLVIRALAGGRVMTPTEQDLPGHFREWVRKLGLTGYEASLRFALAKPGVSSLVLGISETSHVVQAAAAVSSGPLHPEDLSLFRRLASPSDLDWWQHGGKQSARQRSSNQKESPINA